VILPSLLPYLMNVINFPIFLLKSKFD
jgi:hypothetical protein